MRIRLRDGRTLGVEDHGEGTPIVWLPGTPGSRVWKPPFVPDGVRLVVVERPGFGESDAKPARRVLDWPEDLSQVADHFGFDAFVLAGTSGAGPYLLASGAKLASRIRRLGLVACIGPPELQTAMPAWRRAAFALARRAPRLVRATLPRDPEAFYRALSRDAAPCDRVVLDRIWASQVEMTAEALRQGPDAFVHELALASRPWGFALEDVRTDVVMWHGLEDRAAPIEVAREVARRLPKCETHFVPEAGHFVHYDHWGAVIDSLRAPVGTRDRR